MAEVKNDKIKSLEEKLRNLVSKKKTESLSQKENKSEVKVDKKTEISNTPIDVEEELPENKAQTFSSNDPSRFIPEDLRPSGLSFSEPTGGFNGTLERNLGDVPAPTDTDSQKKQEEAYQTAKLMYEENDNKRRVQTGREVMRAPSVSPLSRDPLLAGNSFGARGSVAMFNPNPDANDDSGGKLYEVNDIRDNKKKLAWEVGVGENDIRKYN